MAVTAAVFRAARRFAYVILIVGLLGFTVATHTVGFIANATSVVIRTVFGLTTVASDATAQARMTGARADRLNTDMEDLRTHQATIDAENIELRHRATRSDADLLDANTRATALDLDLASERRVSADLRTDILRLGNAGPMVDFRGERISLREANSRVMRGIQTRTRRTALTNAGSVPGESIPFYGIAFVVAATGYELTSACATMRDLHDLEVAMNPDALPPEDRDIVCGLQVPTREEAWQSVREAPGVAWAGAVSAYDQVPEVIANLETPDFNTIWSNAGDWFSGFFDYPWPH